ncbi:MAG: NAD(P)-dependent oxidoreductase [Myxococcaceae bacterium]|nr:NAD(P)-dependent oxidoreductase [Myxococcaceae bacterium]
MRIFVAGATGAIGRQLVPLLLEAGHEVIAMTRDARRAEPLQALGASIAVANALDYEQVREAISRADPEVVVNELTALPKHLVARHVGRSFAATNTLRTVGTDHLIGASRAAGVRHFVAQGFAGWPYAPIGHGPLTEDTPFDPHPPAQLRATLQALEYLEQSTAVCGIASAVLRYGLLYGPGTAFDSDGAVVEAVRRRRLPIIGSGEGMSCFIHVQDAAMATLRAIERGAIGVYNVVDDMPAAARDWIPGLAHVIGAPPPFHVPRWIALALLGEATVAILTRGRPISNARARSNLGWWPRFPSWREGFLSIAEGAKPRPSLRPAEA